MEDCCMHGLLVSTGRAALVGKEGHNAGALVPCEEGAQGARVRVIPPRLVDPRGVGRRWCGGVVGGKEGPGALCCRIPSVCNQ